MKGGISNYNFVILQQYIQTFSKKTIYMSDLMRIIEADNTSKTQKGEPLITLSEDDWCIVIKKAHEDGIRFIFGVSPLEESLRIKFDYSRPSIFSTYTNNTEAFPLRPVYNFVQKTARKRILMNDILTYIEFLKTRSIQIVLGTREWNELIAECYFRHRIHFIFDDSTVQRRLNKEFNYQYLDYYFSYLGNIGTDKTPIPSPSVLDPRARPVEEPPPSRREPAEEPPPARREPVIPRQPSRTLSISQPVQGDQRTCFAHAASLMIYHNMYNELLERMTPGEMKNYQEKNCNQYLNTTTPFPPYEIIHKQCGDTGASRILLYIYIYRMLVKEFGCDGGRSLECMLYYLKTDYQPNMFDPSMDGLIIDALLIPIYRSVDKSNFAVSEIDMDRFTKLPRYRFYLNEYFKYYYARISTPDHAFVIGNISDAGIEGKDTMIGANFTIPFSQFHRKGKITLQDETFDGFLTISFLYDKSKLPEFSPEFSRLLVSTEVK
jgi:hypothetical protein